MTGLTSLIAERQESTGNSTSGRISVVTACILLAHSPNRYLGSAIILLLFFYQLTRGSIISLGKYSMVISIGFIVAFSIGFLSFLLHYSSLNNLFWFLFNIAPFVVGPILLGNSTLNDIQAALKFFVTIEGFVLGVQYLQVAYQYHSFDIFTISKGAAGDGLSGTLLGFSSPLAISLMITCLAFVALYMHLRERRLLYWSAFAGIFSFLPGMMAGTAIFVLSFVLFLVLDFVKGIFTMKMTRISFMIGLVLVSLCGVLVFTQTSNIKYASILIPKLISANPPVKVQMIQNTVDLFHDEPATLITGVGIGNFSSRSALMVSGQYFSAKISGIYISTQPFFIPVSVSEFTKKYVLNSWNREMLTKYVGGIIGDSMANDPFNFHLSLLAECGLVGYLFVFGALGLVLLLTFLRRQASITIFILFTFLILGTNDWISYPTYAILFWTMLRIADLTQQKLNFYPTTTQERRMI
jgi:hypothetical protein